MDMSNALCAEHAATGTADGGWELLTYRAGGWLHIIRKSIFLYGNFDSEWQYGLRGGLGNWDARASAQRIVSRFSSGLRELPTRLYIAESRHCQHPHLSFPSGLVGYFA